MVYFVVVGVHHGRVRGKIRDLFDLMAKAQSKRIP